MLQSKTETGWEITERENKLVNQCSIEIIISYVVEDASKLYSN